MRPEFCFTFLVFGHLALCAVAKVTAPSPPYRPLFLLAQVYTSLRVSRDNFGRMPLMYTATDSSLWKKQALYV